MEKLFRKARQSRIFQDVVDQIQDAILSGQLKPGNKLPPERELGDMLGTSRGTLREALRVLEQKGLIEIRLGVGGGAIVKDTNTEQISESLALLIRSQKVSLAHLAEFREDVEGTVTGLAAQRAKANDINHLNVLLDEARRYYEGGSDFWDDFVRIDEKLHMALAQIAGNPLYLFILRTVHDNIHRYYDRFLTGDPYEFEENYHDLRRIVRAVEQKETDTARNLARDHVRRFNKHMQSKKRNIEKKV